MFEKLKTLYLDGKIDEIGLEKAVQKGWLTEIEKESIKNQP